MQNKLSSIGAELEKDRCKGVEMRELNNTYENNLKCYQLPLRNINVTKRVTSAHNIVGSTHQESSQHSLRKTRRKECHRFWLRLHHAVILISNVRTSFSKKINQMALI